MAKVNIKIEGFPYQVEDGITIMDLAEHFYEDDYPEENED